MPATAPGIRMNHAWLRRLSVATLTALIGAFSAGISAADISQSWSVVVHIEYIDGTVYEHAFAVGVPTSTLSSILAECGSAHRGGSAVRFYCYPVPE